MQVDELTQAIVNALEDVKAKDIMVLDVSEYRSVFDVLVIASGDSNRQVRALANNVRSELKAKGAEVIGMEGEENGEWVLVDFGSVVVHVMLPPIRDYYNIEQLWGGQKPAFTPNPFLSGQLPSDA